MHQVTLQAYSYRSMVERCQRLNDSSQLVSTIVATFSDPQLLNESFKLNLYKFNDRTNHNVDLDFAVRFFEDIGAEKVVGSATVTATAVLSV